MAKNLYSERFLSIVDKIGISDAKIANSIDGLDKTLMSHIRTGRQGASINVLSSFCEAYPQVNANYILTGKGDMFLNTAAPIADMPKEGTEELPSPESAEYWERMYKSAVTTYEAMLQNLEERFNVLDKSLSGIREFLVERKKAV